VSPSHGPKKILPQFISRATSLRFTQIEGAHEPLFVTRVFHPGPRGLEEGSRGALLFPLRAFTS
jgi:hypothetical protein